MAVCIVHAPRGRRESCKRGGVRDGVEEDVVGALVLSFLRREEQAIASEEVGRLALAWRTHTGHALPFDAFRRARGG